MILYHGSNMAIDGIDLNRCRPYKDFGRGFYLTDIREQAPVSYTHLTLPTICSV